MHSSSYHIFVTRLFIQSAQVSLAYLSRSLISLSLSLFLPISKFPPQVVLNAIPAVFMSFRVLFLLLLHFQNTRKSLEISKSLCIVFVVTFPLRYTADNCHLFVIAARKEMMKRKRMTVIEKLCASVRVSVRPSVVFLKYQRLSTPQVPDFLLLFCRHVLLLLDDLEQGIETATKTTKTNAKAKTKTVKLTTNYDYDNCLSFKMSLNCVINHTLTILLTLYLSLISTHTCTQRKRDREMKREKAKQTYILRD